MLILIVAVGAVVAYLLVSTAGGSFGMSDSSANPATVKIAQAIAFAEGFYSSGSRAARNHNPGDLTKDLIGKGVGMDGPFIQYATDDDGWKNLYAQINLWFSGGSANATANSTISDLSSFYTTPGTSGNDQTDWANNVASHLGVDPDTPIGSIS